MNSMWRKIWPEHVPNFYEFARPETIPEIHKNTVALASDLAFEEIMEADVMELLQSHR